MLKNTLKTVAAMLFASVPALAIDVSGNYVSQSSNGQQISMQLSGEGRNVQGTVTYNGTRMSLVGEEYNGQLRGTLSDPTGRQMPFVGARTQNGVVIQTADGAQYMFSAAGAAPARQAPAMDNPNFAPPARGAAAPAEIGGVQMQQGQVFAIPVPAGWKVTADTICETFACAPDLSLGYGFVGLERIQAKSAQNFLLYILNLYGNKNIQITNVRAIQYPGMTEAIEAEYTVISAAGKPVKGWARVTTMVAGNSMNAYCLMAFGTAENADQVPQLIGLAEKIQITNAQLAFDRARALDNIRMVKNNPLDPSYTNQYWKTQQTYANVYARGSDVRRGQYGASDPTTGQRYIFGVNGYDPARGGYVNPRDPSQLLVPDPHWQGR